MSFDTNAGFTIVEDQLDNQQYIEHSTQQVGSFDPNDGYTIVNDGSINTNQNIVEKTINELEGFSIYSNPKENTNDAYVKAYNSTIAKLKAEDDRLKTEEAKLDAQANSARKTKYNDLSTPEMKPNSWAWEKFTGRKLDTDQIMGKYNYERKLAEEQAKVEGKKFNKQAFDVSFYNTLEEAGATGADLRAYSQAKRGVTLGTEVFGETVGAAPKLAKEMLTTHVAEPMKYGAARTGLAMASVITDLKGIVTDVEDEKQVLDIARGFIDAVEKDYEEKYGAKSFVQSATESIPYVALMAYNPITTGGKVSWSKLAFADGAYEYAIARGKGYDKIQSGAQGVVAAGITRTIGKLFDIGEEIITNYAKAGKAWEDIKSIDDLSPKYKKQIRELQSINGWEDNEVISIVNGFKDGLEDGKLNTIDAIRLLAQNSHSPEGRKIFEETVLYNRKTAKNFLKESDKRAKSILDLVDKNSDLGKIVYTNKLTKYGHTSLNWRGIVDLAERRGINMNTTMMKRIRNYADQFEDFDHSYHKVLIKKGMAEPRTLIDDVGDTLTNITEAYLGRHIAKMTGTAYFMTMSIPKFVIRSMKKLLPNTVSDDIGETIVKSLGRQLDPKILKREIKKNNPGIPDKQLNDLVEQIIRDSQKSERTRIKEAKRRAAKEAKEAKARAKEQAEKEKADEQSWAVMTDEEAEILYRDLKAEEKALAMERAQKEADELARLNEELKIIKDKEAEIRMYGRDIDETIKALEKQKKEMQRKELEIARVNYKARQYDLRQAEKAVKNAKTKETKIEANKLVKKVKKAKKEAAQEVQVKAREVGQLKPKKPGEQGIDVPNTTIPNTGNVKSYTPKTRNAVRYKINALSKDFGGTSGGKELQRRARDIAGDYAFGKDFMDTYRESPNRGKGMSSYLVRYKDILEIDPKQVQEYYLVNPSRLSDGSFGVPKVIANKYNIPQRKVDVPKALKDAQRLESNKPLSKQDQDMEIENRIGFAETGKVNNDTPKCKG